jgi:glutamate 5-kinase
MDKRIVIKIGTNTLTDEEGSVDSLYLESVAEQVSELLSKGYQVVIVSSGAIGAGSVEMGFKEKTRDVPTRQALASVGQGIIMKMWHDAFSSFSMKVGQILLTYDDFSNRGRYLNLKNSIEKLLKMGVVPIINENDPISVSEIGESFGDNDKLSALFASKIDASKLLLLSDIDGFFDKDPKKNNDAKLLSKIDEITPDMEKMCGKKGSSFSAGGMDSKLSAIKIAVASGVEVVLCNGRKADCIKDSVSGKDIGTVFVPHKTLNQKKQWIKEAKSIGKIHVDEGAKKAMVAGKNLLPAGIVKVERNFDCDAIVDVICSGKVFAKAIIDYSSDALLKIIGKKTSEVKIKAGNVIKRENLVIF